MVDFRTERKVKLSTFAKVYGKRNLINLSGLPVAVLSWDVLKYITQPGCINIRSWLDLENKRNDLKSGFYCSLKRYKV